MSAFMVNNSTLTKIAKYMEVCANYDHDHVQAIWDITLDSDFKKCLVENGCFTGSFSAQRIHALLYRLNREALIALYGKTDTDSMMCPSEIEPMEDGGTEIDIKMETRKEWLSNLYTVCRCYQYQITEGDYKKNKFYSLFSEWIDTMAMALAAYVVDEVRPKGRMGDGIYYKTWDEF